MASPIKHLRSTVNSDGGVILDIERSEITRLNVVGGYIWERLEQGKPVDEIVHELAAEANADIAIVDRDVSTFLAELTSKHLLDE